MNLIAVIDRIAPMLPALVEGGELEFGMNKKGVCKVGTLARVIAAGSKDDRAGLGFSLYKMWLIKGQFRPIVNDVLRCGLLSEDMVAYIQRDVGTHGSVKKEKLIQLCRTVVDTVDNKMAKAAAAGKTPREPKGDKGFVLTFCREIARMAREEEEAAATVIENAGE